MIKQLMLAVTLLGLVAFLPSLGRAGEEAQASSEVELIENEIPFEAIKEALRAVNLDICEVKEDKNVRGKREKRKRCSIVCLDLYEKQKDTGNLKWVGLECGCHP